MITLELTEEEAFNLRTYLGVHHVKSAYDTYSVYEKLADALDGDMPLSQQAGAAVDEYMRSKNLRKHMEIDEQGLIIIKERV